MSIEFDDDKSRIDVEAIHAFLSTQAYWAIGRPLETQQRLVDEASRVVGLYDGERQIGFCRAVTDGVSFAYLADVYVLPEYRRRGLGERLLRHMIDDGPHKRPPVAAAHRRHASALSEGGIHRAERPGDGTPP